MGAGASATSDGGGVSIEALLSETKRYTEADLRAVAGEKFSEAQATAFAAAADGEGTVDKAELMQLIEALVSAAPVSASAPAPASGAELGTTAMATTALAATLTASEPYDVIVVGGGPAGLAAATRAAILGRRCALIDAPYEPAFVSPTTGLDAFLGAPTGLFSKALRDTAKHVDISALRALGMDDDVIWTQVVAKCLQLATHNASHSLANLRSFKVDYVQGRATLAPAPSEEEAEAGGGGERLLEVSVEKADGPSISTLSTEHLLVCTGSSPMALPGVPFDNVRLFGTCGPPPQSTREHRREPGV